MSLVSHRQPLVIGTALLLGTLLAGAASDEQPAEAPAQEEGAPAAEEGAKGRSRRPVMAPGQSAPAAPPPGVALPVRTEPKDEAPAEPPPPLQFADEPVVTTAAPAEEEEPQAGGEEITDPAEVRYYTRKGNLHVEMRVRPGIPVPGEPVEIGWRLEEQLLIPDPYLGDRRPLSGVEIVATVGGPEPERRYEVHAEPKPGNFGFTFTPHSAGLYRIALARRDGRSGVEVEMQLPVGQPPLPATRSLEVKRYPRAPIDPSDTKAQMRELARRWMALERAAGTPQAVAAHTNLVEFARQLEASAPPPAKRGYAALVQMLGTIPTGGPKEQTLGQMDEVNFQTCLRCHAVARLEFAEDISNWPRYTPNPNLKPPASSAPGAAPRRGPVLPVRK